MLSQEPYQRFSAPKSLKWQKGILKLESPGETFFMLTSKKEVKLEQRFSSAWTEIQFWAKFEIWSTLELCWIEKKKKVLLNDWRRRRNINWNVFDLKSRLVSSSIPHHKKNILRRLEDFFPKKIFPSFLTQKDYLESSGSKNQRRRKFWVFQRSGSMSSLFKFKCYQFFVCGWSKCPFDPTQCDFTSRVASPPPR